MSWYEDGIKKHKRYQFTDLTSDIDILYPPFAFCILKLFINAYKEGLRVCVFETYRSQERQSDLFNKGKTKLSKNGMHHFGVATDVVFRTEKNQPIWQGNWNTLGKIGKELGLFWGGDWESFRDYPHFQLIQATPSEQAKIIGGNYPSYEDKVNAYIQQLIPFYRAVVEENYADDKFNALIQCYENLFVTPPKTEVVKEPEPKEVKVLEKTPQPDIKIQEQPIKEARGVLDFIVELINRWMKKKELYQCPECGFHYAEKEWAGKCGAWCREHKSCNIEITAHAEENKKV